jgi:hypothetical protein
MKLWVFLATTTPTVLIVVFANIKNRSHHGGSSRRRRRSKMTAATTTGGGMDRHAVWTGIVLNDIHFNQLDRESVTTNVTQQVL